jgi:hypothetical protein
MDRGAAKNTRLNWRESQIRNCVEIITEPLHEL